MQRAPTVAILAAAYLALAGAALLVWLARPAAALPGYVAALCAAPVLVHALIALGARRDARQLVVGSFAWALFAPILLLMWGASSEFAAPAPAVAVPAASGADELDVQALFASALAVQQVPSTHPDVLEQRASAFADGSELRWTRFAHASAAARYLDFVRANFAGEAQQLGDRRGMRARIAGADRFVYWERHGRSLLELHAADAAQALARLRAQQVPLPHADTLAPAPPVAQPRAVWPFALGYSLAHVLAMGAFLVWAGAATTRVDAAPAVRAVPNDQLLARLDALNGLGARLAVAAGASPLERIVDLNMNRGATRAHRLSLRVDPHRALVRVRESEGAYGAAPRDSDEADMRSPGQLGIDPSRPRARKIWVSKVQTSIIDGARLAQIPLRLDGAAVELPPGLAQQLDADGVIHLVCAVVTRSGFVWQPVFFDFQG